MRVKDMMVKDMTVGELQDLVRHTIEQALDEFFVNPDRDLPMTIPMSVQTVIKSIQALSPEEQLVLFDRLGQLGMEKQVRENVKPTSNPSDDPWVKYAGMFKDDPDFDDFLAEMEAYRREIDAEIGNSDAYANGREVAT